MSKLNFTVTLESAYFVDYEMCDDTFVLTMDLKFSVPEVSNNTATWRIVPTEKQKEILDALAKFRDDNPHGYLQVITAEHANVFKCPLSALIDAEE